MQDEDGVAAESQTVATENPAPSSVAQVAPLGPCVRDVIRWVYTNNPFYIISAGLVFWGLRVSFDTGQSHRATWALLLGLAGYTLLLAVAAVALIRWGRVWDDARSLLLLIVLGLLATSVVLDDRLASSPEKGRWYFLAGFAFAVTVSELVIRAIRLRFEAAFRVPYYLILGVFFGYPVLVSPLLIEPTLLTNGPSGSIIEWALWGFAPLAGLAFLSLLPAARMAADRVRDPASPWLWPWYPWTVFGLLAFCAFVRAYYVCVSLHFISGQATIFEPFFWAPLGFCVMLVALEIAVTARHQTAQRAVMLAMWVLPIMALFAQVKSSPAQNFGLVFEGSLGATPQFCILMAAMLFSGLALLRSVAGGNASFLVALAFLSSTGPHVHDFDDLHSPQAWLWWAIAVWQLAIAVRRGQSFKALLATAAAFFGVIVEFRDDPYWGEYAMLAWYAVLIAQLAIAWTFDDLFAKQMRRVVPIELVLTTAAIGLGQWLFDLSSTEATLHTGGLICLSLVSGWLSRSHGYYLAAVAQGGIGSIWMARRGWVWLRHWVPGLDWIGVGIVFFLLAGLVSAWKVDAWRRAIRRRLPRRNRDQTTGLAR